jgi:ankyrin repeat protein
LKIVDLLLKSGADVDAGDDTSGRRAIHEAAEKGRLEVLGFLLERGADINALDKWNFTPLHRAAFQGGSDNVRLLIDKGANVSAKTCRGQTALDLACENAQIESIRILSETSRSSIDPSQYLTKELRFDPSVPWSARQEAKAVLMESLQKLTLESPTRALTIERQHPAS